MGELIQGIAELLGVQSPTTLGELLPWIAGLLFAAGFISTLLDWIKSFVRGVGRDIR